MYVCTEVVKFLNAGYSWNTPCDHECVHNPCASRPCSEGVGAMRGIVCNKTRTRQNDEYTTRLVEQCISLRETRPLVIAQITRSP